MEQILYPIKVVAKRTGLSPHVIRAWEKRYDAVSPHRTDTNRRLYSTEQIERLTLLRLATAVGWNIGRIAQYPTDQLKSLLSDNNASDHTPTRLVHETPGKRTASDNKISNPEYYLDACLRAVEIFEVEKLEHMLSEASVYLSQPVLLDQVIEPMMSTIGERWREGALRISQEHMASAAVRTFVGHLRSSYETTQSAPVIIVTTPAGQIHENAALIASITAASEGWRVTYLGPNLPAEEIAGAVVLQHASAVALSIIYPAGDPGLRDELLKLRHQLPEEVAILVGGKGMSSYGDVLDTIGAFALDNMQDFRQVLERLRLDLK